MAMRVVLFFLVVHFAGSAQDVNEVLKKMQAHFLDNPRLEYYSTYELFKGSSEDLESRYSGYVYKENELLYQKINGTEFVFGKEFTLKINSEQRSIELENIRKFNYGELDLAETLKFCSEKKIKKKNGFYVIDLIMDVKLNTGLQKISLKINSEDYQMNQLDLYYSVLQEFSKSNGIKELDLPSMRVTIYNFSVNPKKNEAMFEFSTYLSKVQNAFFPQAMYEGYTFIDNR